MQQSNLRRGPDTSHPAFIALMSACAPKGRGTVRGYSMTEMLMVLLIIAILSTTLLGAYGRLQRNTRLTNSADKILSTLMLARSLAISNNTIYHVRMEHWDTVNGAPNPDPALKIFCYPKFTDAVNAPADPDASSAYIWSFRGTLKDPVTGAAYLATGGQPFNNYLVETVKLDHGNFLGQHFSSPAALDETKQNNLLSFNPDGTASQTNQTGVYTLYVTDIDKMARPVSDAGERRVSFNKESGAKFQRSNIIMIDVLPGGIVRLRKEDLP